MAASLTSQLSVSDVSELSESHRGFVMIKSELRKKNQRESVIRGMWYLGGILITLIGLSYLLSVLIIG